MEGRRYSPESLRLYVPLDSDEHRALCEMCNQDFRGERETLRWLLRQEAIKRGLLTPEGTEAQPQRPQRGKAEGR